MCNSCVKILKDPADPRPWVEQKMDWSLKFTDNIEYTYWYRSNANKETVTKSLELDKNISYCICGHIIARKFPVYNDKRAIACILGCVCICRYKKNDKKTTGAFDGNEVMKQQMIELNKYYCISCDKTMSIERVIKHNDSPSHKKNYKSKNFRVCKICKEYAIEKIKPAYYHTCSRCYKFVVK